MGNLKKFLLFIILLMCVGFSVCLVSLFYPIPYISDTVLHYQNAYPRLNYVLAGYCAVVALISLILLLIVLFFPSRPNFLVISKEKGRLQFSKKTVESTVRYSFADARGISSSKIKVKINKKPEKTKVLVNLSVNDTAQLAVLAESLQDKISASLQSSLGIGIKSITVKVNEFNAKELNATESNTPETSIKEFESTELKATEFSATETAATESGDEA